MTIRQTAHKDPFPSQQPRRTRWGLIGRVVFTLAILGFLVSRLDLHRVGTAIRESLGGWFALAFVPAALGIVLSTFKWDRLLRAVGIFAPKRMLLELYTIGMFASVFLPGPVGGDVVRFYLAGERGERVKVAATIFLERVCGVIALTLLCLLAVVLNGRFATPPILALIGCVCAALVVGLTLSLNRRLATVSKYLTRRHRIRVVARPLYSLHRTLRSFPRKPLLVAVGFSFLFYFATGSTFYLICRAFNAEVTFVEASSVRLLICLLSIIPVSIGGLGIAQAGDVYLFGILGVEIERAMGISLIRVVINYTYSLIGGILFIRWRGNRGATKTGVRNPISARRTSA